MHQDQGINNEEFVKVIDKINELIKKFEEYKKQNLQVVMLVGNTGNGKSTLFNFLSGFDLVTKQDSKKTSLQLKNPQQEGTSIIKGGLISVIKEPQYYFSIHNSHLLIDFPGFHDTKGFMQQSLIQILFNRIVTQTSIKIVYVVKQSDDELSGRGRELQKFISQCFGQQNQDFTQITLLLNSYMGDLEDEELASSVRLQLQEIYEKPNEKIIVVRKIKSDQELKEYFSKAKRDELWKSIETSYTIKFKPAQFQRHGEIATFINSRCFSFTNKLVSEICQSLDKQIEKLDKEKMKTLLFHFMEIGLLIEMDMNQNVYGWYEKLINISQQITELLGCQNNIKKEISTFLKIFKFLSQEEDIIETKVVLRENSELIKNQLITQEKTIRYKMTVIENEANARKDEPQMLEFLQILQSAMILKELQNKNELEKKRQERESQKNCIVF